MRLARLAALVVEKPKQMQRVEIVALQLQRPRIELLGLVETALLMQRHRLSDGLRQMHGRLAGQRHDYNRLIRAIRRVTSAGVA